MTDSFTFDGRSVPMRAGDTVASALYRNGVRILSRSMKYHRPRGVYCNTGSCASCLVEVEGRPNRLACMEPARPGLKVVSQNRIGSAERDLLAVTDKVYPRGFDPHGAFTGSLIVNRLFMKAVRFMSGVGRAPKAVLGPEDGTPPRFRRLIVDTLVVGGGRHGLAAARAACGEDTSTLLVEEAARLGGSAAWDPAEEKTRQLAQEAAEGAWPGFSAWTQTLAFGVYGDEVGLMRGDDLWSVTPRRLILAPGRYDGWPVFAQNDLPGVLSLRGAQRLLGQHGVLPGRRIVVHGDPLPDRFRADLETADAVVVATGSVTAVRGHGQVREAKVDGAWIACDAVVCVLPRVPRIELFQQAGCRITTLDGMLVPETDADGRTSRPDVYAALDHVPHLEALA